MFDLQKIFLSKRLARAVAPTASLQHHSAEVSPYVAIVTLQMWPAHVHRSHRESGHYQGFEDHTGLHRSQ